MKEIKLPEITDKEKLILIRDISRKIHGILIGAFMYKRPIGNTTVDRANEIFLALTDENYFENVMDAFDKSIKIKTVGLINSKLEKLRSEADGQ